MAFRRSFRGRFSHRRRRFGFKNRRSYRLSRGGIRL